MRWRFFAAKVCATEIDSTNPMTEIRIAGNKSAPIRSNEKSGKVSGGRLCGTAPTMRTPWSDRPNSQTMTVVSTTAATGPALVATSAAPALTPFDFKNGLSPLRTQNRNPVADTPMISVIQFVSPRWIRIEWSSSIRFSPDALMPKICLIWLAAIMTPDAVIKPAITGWDRKLAKNPSLNTPIASKIAPDRNASVRAATA